MSHLSPPGTITKSCQCFFYSRWRDNHPVTARNNAKLELQLSLANYYMVWHCAIIQHIGAESSCQILQNGHSTKNKSFYIASATMKLQQKNFFAKPLWIFVDHLKAKIVRTVKYNLMLSHYLNASLTLISQVQLIGVFSSIKFKNAKSIMIQSAPSPQCI